MRIKRGCDSWYRFCSIPNQDIASSISQKMNKTLISLIAAMFGGVVSALAIPASLDIDLRIAAWATPPGTVTETVGNLTGTAAYPPGSVLTWSSTNGLSINSPALLGLGTIDILNLTF